MKRPRKKRTQPIKDRVRENSMMLQQLLKGMRDFYSWAQVVEKSLIEAGIMADPEDVSGPEEQDNPDEGDGGPGDGADNEGGSGGDEASGPETDE